MGIHGLSNSPIKGNREIAEWCLNKTIANQLELVGGRMPDLLNRDLRETAPITGNVDPSTGKVTQAYPDGFRHTVDLRPGMGPHWTNQNLPKGHPARHDPPSDAS